MRWKYFPISAAIALPRLCRSDRLTTMKTLNNQFVEMEIQERLGQTTEEVFMAPMIEAARSWRRGLRKDGEGVGDEAFLRLGVLRVARNNESGRDFYQHAEQELGIPIGKSAFFDLFKSSRRLEALKDVAAGLFRDGSRLVQTDLLESFPELVDREILAGDGHLLKAACHAPRDSDGRKVATKSLYMLNVRNGLALPLAAVQGDGKYGHELPPLRRALPQFMQGGLRRKNRLSNVLFLLDAAFTDTVFWTDVDAARKLGAEVVVPERKDLKVYRYENLAFDRTAQVNAGVVSCELVGFEDPESSTMRRVVYCDPETGNRYAFLRTATDMEPGLVALLYLLRWRIEKVFDVFKNKLHERKAWGNGPVCQQVQAHFACMAHNLILLLAEKLKNDHGIEPIKLHKKRKKALEIRERQAKARGGYLNPLHWMIRLPSQVSLQFIRSLRHGIAACKLFSEHLLNFRRVMESYI